MKINKCPFCANDVQLITFYTNTYSEYYIQCNYCKAKGPISEDKNEALESWNNVLIDVYIKDIYSDYEIDELDESKSIAIFNKKVYNSYIQIYYNKENDNFEFMLLYRPKFSLTYVPGKSYIKYCNSLTEGFDIFHKCYIKLNIDIELNKIINDLNLEVFKL